jgi:hypothetical protein
MSEYKFHWLESHLENLDKAKETAEEFTWRISIVKRGDEWFVFDGEARILSSNDRAVVDAFLYGLGLAYACIPEPYYSQLKKDLNNWLDEQM